MSQQNIDVARRTLEAFNTTGVGAAIDGMDPEVEFVGGGGAVYHGHAGVRELESLLRESFDEIRIEADEFRTAGDAVIALGRIRVQGRASGAAGESRRAWVMTFAAGRIVRLQTYEDQDEALEAVGALD